jgi:hypothetical protein
LTSSTVIVIAAVSVSAPLSVTVTTRLNTVPKSISAWLATVIAPDAGSIAKAPFVLPEVIAYDSRSPASSSVASTVPTGVPLALFSSTENAASVASGASLTPVRLTVTTAVSVRLPAPLSVTVICRSKLGVVSKSSAAELATVMAPVLASIANTVCPVPPVMA